VPKQLLFIPGPVTVAEPVLAATGQPLIDHRGGVQSAARARVAADEADLRTTRAEVLVLGASGTGGLEAAVTNLFGPGDRLLACPIGVFGERLIAIARTWGCRVDALETAWGSALEPAALRARLAAATGDERYTGVLLTHNETSTGRRTTWGRLPPRCAGTTSTRSSIRLAASAHRRSIWILGFRRRGDRVAEGARRAAGSRWSPSPRGLGTHGCESRAALLFRPQEGARLRRVGADAVDASVSIVFGIDAALEAYEREGAPSVWERHERYARAIRACAAAMGLEVYSKEGAHSLTVVAIRLPRASTATRSAVRCANSGVSSWRRARPAQRRDHSHRHDGRSHQTTSSERSARSRSRCSNTA